MKSSTLLESPVFTEYTGEINNNLSFTNPYRYSYQSQEKSDASNPWYQFELRNYNQDLGRWFAPDPYGQFASPYIAMANDPISFVDPDGGWVNASAGGAKWAGKRQMEIDRANHTGAFDYAHVQARYDNEYENIRQNCLLDNNGGDIAGFLNQVKALNSKYYGLNQYGSQNFTARTGVEYLTANEMGLNSSQVLGANQSIHVSEFVQRNRQDMAESANRTNSDARSAHDILEVKSHADAPLHPVSTEVYAIMNKLAGQSDAEGIQTGKKVVNRYSDGTEITFSFDNNGNLTGLKQKNPNNSTMPTEDVGAFIEKKELFDYMLDQARTNPVEVVALEVKNSNDPEPKYFVMPWKGNTKKESYPHIKNVGDYISGYKSGDVKKIIHTHPKSTPPSPGDKILSDTWKIPVYTIGAKGNSWIYYDNKTRPTNLEKYLYN